MLPAAQVTAQQQLHPTAMVLLLLRYPSPHLSREQHRSLRPAACQGQTLSLFLVLLLGCLCSLQRSSHDVTLSGTACSWSSSTTWPSSQQQLSLKGQRGAR